MKRTVFPNPFQSLALRRSIDVRRPRKLRSPADLAGLSPQYRQQLHLWLESIPLAVIAVVWTEAAMGKHYASAPAAFNR